MCNLHVKQEEISEVNAIAVLEEVLQVHGYAPSKKAEGSVCLVYENVNRYINWLCNNNKVEQSKEIHDVLKVDVAVYCKHKMNMKHRQIVHGFNQLFKGSGAAIHILLRIMYKRTLVGHNKGEQVYCSLGT